MIQQRFALLTLAICLLTLNIFAQKNTNIQSKVNTTTQPQAKVITHTTKKEVTPLYQRVTKTEPITRNKQTVQPEAIIKPRFGSYVRSRPHTDIYANLDTRIETVQQTITNLEADPNHDEKVLAKYRTTLQRLQKLKAEKPTNQ